MALGEILKQKRLEHGWTKEYVAERTHMMVRSIDALETESFKRIPAPLYGRGFIKQYCALLGIEAQPLIDEYMAKVSGSEAGRSVTHPVVHDLPDQPVAPIHTAGKRTLPPKEPLKETPVTSHKTVEPPEASHTAVPRPETLMERTPPASQTPAPEVVPEPTPVAASPVSPIAGKWVMPPAQSAEIPESIPTPMDSDPAPVPSVPPPPPAEDDEPAFTLQGDTLPASAAPMGGRSGLTDPASKAPRKGHTMVESASASATYPTRSEGARAIFGPQQPIETPPNPQWSRMRLNLKNLWAGIAESFRRLTHPKVQRMTDQNEPLVTHRMVLKAITIFGVLVVLTLLVLLFRWIFQQSAESEVESLAAPRTEATAETAPAETAPVPSKTPFRAPLPEPYFK